MARIAFSETEAAAREWLNVQLTEFDLHLSPVLVRTAADAEIVSVFINSRIDTEFFAHHPRVRFIATRSTTTEHSDLVASAARGVAVCNVPAYGDYTRRRTHLRAHARARTPVARSARFHQAREIFTRNCVATAQNICGFLAGAPINVVVPAS